MVSVISRKSAVKIIDLIGYRRYEFMVALKYLNGCDKILDVGCGKGAFLEEDPGRIEGIDINPDNIAVCVDKGLRAKVGNALDIPYDDNTFDGAYCSHVIQIFDYEKASQLLRELRRVVRSEGVVVLASFPDHKRLFFTPETFRAYPPNAIRALIKQPEERIDRSNAPTHSLPLLLKQESIWLRRPPLIEFTGPRSEFFSRLAILLNQSQHFIFLRKYWDYNGYVMKLRNGPK